MTNTVELPIPPDVLEDKQAVELLRAWEISEGGRMIVNPHAFENPATWGIILADALQHICGAYNHYYNIDPEQLKFAILKTFMAEVQSPTDEATPDPSMDDQ